MYTFDIGYPNNIEMFDHRFFVIILPTHFIAVEVCFCHEHLPCSTRNCLKEMQEKDKFC